MRLDRQAFIIYIKWRKSEKTGRNVSPKTLVSNVILTFLDHLKPKIFFVSQPWGPTQSPPSPSFPSHPFQNLWIHLWGLYTLFAVLDKKHWVLTDAVELRIYFICDVWQRNMNANTAPNKPSICTPCD